MPIYLSSGKIVKRGTGFLFQGNPIAASRRIDWTPAGVVGGIPSPRTTFANVRNSPYNAVGDGVADDTTAIQNAINDCTVGQEVYIPAGSYKLTSQLQISKGITLRGDGVTSKLLSYANWHAIQIGDFPSSPVATNVNGNPNKGDTTISVSSVSSPSISNGTWIVIDQINDGVEVINVDDQSRDSNTRCMSQIVKVTNVTGSGPFTLTLDQPLYHGFVSAQTPQVWVLNQGGSLTSNAGLEDLWVERVSPTTINGYSNIKVVNALNCWFQNVRSKLAEFRHIDFDRSVHCEVRRCYFDDGIHQDTGGEAYGVVCANRTCRVKVEDNIFYHLRHSLVVKEGAAGNVYGYNYIVNGDQGDGWLSGDISVHGAHAMFNLFEGNMGSKIYADFTHGSSSYNTFLRNAAIRDSQPTNPSNSRRCVDLERTTWYYNLVGNVLGQSAQTFDAFDPGASRTTTTGRYVYCFGYNGDGDSTQDDTNTKATAFIHGNFDYQSNSTIWDSTQSLQFVPKSLYLPSAPAFFGSFSWPAIGSDLTPKVGQFPAKDRYENP